MSVTSDPTISSSSDILIPITALITDQTMSDTTKVHVKIARVPSNCPMKVASPLESRTAKIPQIPHTPCTEMAPTGSSILILSNATIEATTIAPPIAPMTTERPGAGLRGSAVIETRPASAPFNAMVRSDLPNANRAAIKAATKPPAAAMLVLTKTRATAFASSIFDSFSSDPPLNPNQPNHKINMPSVAKGILAPVIGLTLPSALYFPALGPSRITPASAAAAPHM